MLENYLECYHCAVAHPGFSAAIDIKPQNYNLTMHGWFASQVGQVRQAALDGTSSVKIYDASGAVKQAQDDLLWPNVSININPGFPNLSIDVWLPDGANKAKGFCEQYFAPGVTEKFAHDLIAFNKQVGHEDDVLTNSLQPRAAWRDAGPRPIPDQQRAPLYPFPEACCRRTVWELWSTRKKRSDRFGADVDNDQHRSGRLQG